VYYSILSLGSIIYSVNAFKIYGFATMVTLSNSVPIKSVSKMLGHKNLKKTQHYAKILDLKVSNDMKVLKEKLSKNSTLNQKMSWDRQH